MRPLFWHYQDDPQAVAADDQFLLGAALLVAPILRQGATARSVYLPRGDWFDFWTGERHAGRQQVLAQARLDQIPVYARAGSIVPMMAVQQYVGQRKQSIINLHVWPGAFGQIEWYEDDGASLAYTRGETHQRRIAYSQRRRAHTLRFSEARGSFPSEVKVWRVILRAMERPLRAAVNGRAVRGRFNARSRLFAFEFPNTADAVEVRLD